MKTDLSSRFLGLSSQPVGSETGFLLLADADWLLRGEFSREGDSLVITGPSGQIIKVDGFFNLDALPSLITETGLIIDGELASKLAGQFSHIQVAQIGPQLDLPDDEVTEPIGTIKSLEGTVVITRSDGEKIEAQEGDEVFQNDVIETKSGGSLGIEFVDESTVSLGPSGRMVLDEMVYEPDGDSNSSAISVVSGAFSFVSGQIAKASPDAAVLTTPVATIGIRGTTIAGEINGEGQANTISLLPDAGGTVGEVVITNAAGVAVLNQVGASVAMASANEAPPQPTILSQSELSNKYGSVLSVNPSQPTVTGAPANETGESGEGGPGQGGEREAPPDGFKGPRPGSDFGESREGDLKKVRGDFEKAKLEGKRLREGMEKFKEGFERFNDKFEKGLERRAEQNFDSKFKKIHKRVEDLRADQSDDAAPILALIKKAQAAATKASAAETSAATKKSSVEAEVVAKGTANGLDQASANSLSAAITAPLDALGAASALAATASGVMLSAGALLGSLAQGKKVNPQLLASLEAAAREAEVAAAKIDVAVKGSVAAMDTVVASVISTVKSTSGSGKLAAAENIVVQVLSKKINEKMAEEAAKITDAPVGADLASMDVASISTVVDSVQEKVTQAKNQIAALPPQEKTTAMADALVKAEATATKAKVSAEKASATISAKTASEIRARSEEALQAAKEAKALKDEAEALVDFKEIVREADASIAEEALSAYEAFAEAELAVEQAATAIASADSSQELALDYVSGVLTQKKDALTDGASDGSQGAVTVAQNGSLSYSAAANKFVGEFVSLASANGISADDTFSVTITVDDADTTIEFDAEAGDTLGDAQAFIATAINGSSALNTNIEATAVSRLELTGNFNAGDIFSATIDGTTVTFRAEEARGQDYTIADIRSGLIDAINADSSILNVGVADRGYGAGDINFEFSGTVVEGKTQFAGRSVTWTTPNGSVNEAEYEIKLQTKTDETFNAAATATGSGNSAKTYDVDTFIFSTKNNDGELTANQATVYVVKNGDSLAADNKIIVSDLSDESAIPVSTQLSSITASSATQLSTASSAADAALEVAANSLLQARADLAATLVDDAMARAKSETYAEALDEARARLTQDLKDVFAGEDSSDLGPLDPNLSVLENLSVNAARVDGASDGTMGTTSVSNGLITLNLTNPLAAGESLTETITVSTQSGSIELSGTLEAGDTYRLTADGYPVSYTITDDDISSGINLQQAASSFATAINEDEDISQFLQASVGADGKIVLQPKVSGQPFIASVSAENGEGNATDDNDASYTDVFTTRENTFTYTNETGSSVSSIAVTGLKVVGAEQVSTYATQLSAAFPDVAILESQATLADQLEENTELVETFTENVLSLFNNAIAKVKTSYDEAVSIASDAASDLSDAEAALALKATAYEAAFDLAIDLKSDAANAASDLASATAELAVGEAAARAQASVGLEISLEDAAASASSAAALTLARAMVRVEPWR